jgi:hypothetical protein
MIENDFEGEEIAEFTAQLPTVKLEAEEMYPRGTHIMVSAEYRVRSVHIEEDKKGNLTRHHVLALENLVVTGRQTPEERRAAIAASGDAFDEGTVIPEGTDPVAGADTAGDDTGSVDTGAVQEDEEAAPADSAVVDSLAVDVDADWLEESISAGMPESVNS